MRAAWWLGGLVGCFDVSTVEIGIGDAVVGAGVDTDPRDDAPEPDPEPEVDSDPAPPVDTADTDPLPPVDTADGLVEPEAFSFGALFAYDPVTDQAVPFSWSGGRLGPIIDVQAGTEDFFLAGAGAEGCTFEFMWPGPIGRPAWAAGRLFGLELDRTLPVTHSCAGVLRRRTIPEFEAFIRDGLGWGVGLDAPPLDPNVAAIIAGAGLDGYAIPAGYLLGAPPLTGAGYQPAGAVALGFLVNEDWRVLTDPAGSWLRMRQDEMVIGGQLQRGLYSVSVLYMFRVN